MQNDSIYQKRFLQDQSAIEAMKAISMSGQGKIAPWALSSTLWHPYAASTRQSFGDGMCALARTPNLWLCAQRSCKELCMFCVQAFIGPSNSRASGGMAWELGHYSLAWTCATYAHWDGYCDFAGVLHFSAWLQCTLTLMHLSGTPMVPGLTYWPDCQLWGRTAHCKALPAYS